MRADVTLITLLCAPSVAAFALAPHFASFRGARRSAAPRASADFADDGTRDDSESFDFDLLKIPQITTPERENFKAFRERQRERLFRAKSPNSAPTPQEVC